VCVVVDLLPCDCTAGTPAAATCLFFTLGGIQLGYP
jgi:hypothetical protein